MSKCLMLNSLSYGGTQVSLLYQQQKYERRTREMRWVLLPYLYFQHLLVWIMLLLYFTEDFSFVYFDNNCE